MHLLCRFGRGRADGRPWPPRQFPHGAGGAHLKPGRQGAGRRRRAPPAFGAGQALFARHDALQSARGHFSPELWRVWMRRGVRPAFCRHPGRIAQRELDETCAQLREAGISLSFTSRRCPAPWPPGEAGTGCPCAAAPGAHRVLEPWPAGAARRPGPGGGARRGYLCGGLRPAALPAPTAGPAPQVRPCRREKPRAEKRPCALQRRGVLVMPPERGRRLGR